MNITKLFQKIYKNILFIPQGKHKSKKSKKSKKRHYSDSSSGSEEWVEKPSQKEEKDSSNASRKNHEENKRNREEWMSLPTSFMSDSNLDRRQERQQKKKQEREKQTYNPQESTRELNPYWKDGGDGLPKFKKPTESDFTVDYGYNTKESSSSKHHNWKKKDTKNESTSNKINKDTKECAGKSDEAREDLNYIAAKLVKAEIMGNTKLVEELKQKLEVARNNSQSSISKEQSIILTKTDGRGQTVPVKLQSNFQETSSRKRKQKVETHNDGQRVRYFADDDKYSLKQMFEAEKYSSVEDHNKEFIKMSGKIRKNDDLDDIFTDNIRNKESDSKIDSRNRDRAIQEHHKMENSLDNCNKCIQSEVMDKNLMISMGETMFLSLPAHVPLTEGHCFISPIRHISCATQLDENEWTELMNLRKSLVEMFKIKGEDVIFFECATGLHRFPHMSIECVPIPLEEGISAPIYFKKAIDECEEEWAQNKKLVSLQGRDVRKAIPKGLPYFFVSFGMTEGFAHVIEDERLFPSNFAQEIIGGMLDLHHSMWRKPKRQSFEEQKQRVTEFSKDWSNFDCTTVK